MAPPGLPPLTLIYDGDCGLCQRSVRLFHRLSRIPVPACSSQSLTLHPTLRARALREVLFLSASGQILGGVPAIAAALQAAGRPVLAALLRHAPFASAIYRAVARSRRSLTCPATPPESPPPPSAPAPPRAARN